MKYSFVCVGGTFDLLHKGHKKLLKRAFSLGDKVLVGITSDDFVNQHLKTHEIDSYSERRQELVSFLKEKGWLPRAIIRKIDDPYSPAMISDLEAIIVSEETEETANKINQMRKNRGLNKLNIKKISWVRGQNGKVISSSLIREGIMDREGRTLQKG